MKLTTVGDCVRRVTATRRKDFRDGWWQNWAIWPPNVFAVTHSLLTESGGYRLTVSPPDGAEWPPDKAWSKRIQATAAAWRKSFVREGKTPKRVQELGRIIADAWSARLRNLCEPKWWELCSAILELHIAADEACAGVGIPPPGEAKTMSTVDANFITFANLLVTDTGTLVAPPTDQVCVLPKMRTPQSGIVRSGKSAA